MAVAGGVVALVAIAAGVLVSRSLRAPAWARIPGAIAEVVARPSRVSSPEAAAPVPALPHPEDRASYEQGRRLLAAGQAKRALGPLGDAARGLPQDPAVAHDYGLALVGAGEEDRGLFQLEHASRLAPGIQSYRLDLIRALLAAGRRGPAARELQELLARDPTNQSAAEMLAGLVATTGSAGAPGAAASSLDLGGAASGSGPARPAPVGGAFTNEDLGRRPAAPSPAPSRPSPTASASPGPAH
ncbi:MAG TPA: hypothetical protein VIK51_18315 [Vicinamibacteria bacterium]